MSTNGDENYRVTITRKAQKDISKLPRSVVGRVDEQIRELEIDPRPHGAKKLQGTVDLYRIRVGSYRIIYAIDDSERLVRIAHVRNRRDAYENL